MAEVVDLNGNDYFRYNCVYLNNKEKNMKKIIVSLMAISSLALAFDMAAAAASVDTKKAKDSVDAEKAMAAVASGDISVKAAKDSVDGDKAVSSVDKEKLTKALF